MITLEEMRLIQPFENELLDVIRERDQFTNSDLQGFIQALVYRVYEAGKNASQQLILENK